MGFFNKNVASDETNQMRIPPLGSGRRLRNDLELSDCLAHLKALIFSYRAPESAYRSAYVIPGWRWKGVQQFPETAISFWDSNDNFLLAAFWPNNNGTECGLFPLGSGDERLLSLPIIDHWHHRDPSLRSIGVIPGGQITLAPPRVPDQFVDEIFKVAGFPASPYNLQTIGVKLGQMFLARAHQFMASKDPQAANRFVQSHRYNGGSFQRFYQNILDDLAVWNPDVLPYIQDTPMRVRAISLEAVGSTGSMWDELER